MEVRASRENQTSFQLTFLMKKQIVKYKYILRN